MYGKLFNDTLRMRNDGRPPVWFMRQAGRYHSHYQKLKESHSFMDLCKVPELACETAMGPMRDFNFDAAILFSDLLFPLEVMGTGLRYDPGPKLDWYLRSKEDVAKLKSGKELARQLAFQGEALALTRKALPEEKGLLGFVGGPLTLFFYAVAGSHQGDLSDARAAMKDGRFPAFFEKLFDLLVENMVLQARAGADTIAMLDTCAGEVDLTTYRELVLPAVRAVITEYQKACPEVPVLYYSKGTGPEHWRALSDLPIGAIGIDWHHDMAKTLTEFSGRFAIQGNVDPEWLHLPAAELEKRLREYFARIKALPASARRGWICGLGHGVLQKTPEDNVRLYLKLQKEIFG